MARKWMTLADESSSARLITVPYESNPFRWFSSARLITVPYEYLPIGAPIRPGKSPRQEPFEKRKT